MERLVICACTYRRPAGLNRLLQSLGKQKLKGVSEEQIAVLIVDNSPEGSAQTICANYQNWRFKLHYRHEGRKGLAHARNACLEASAELGASFLLFTDDDCVASPGWVQALFDSLASRKAAAAVGPVFPIFDCIPGPALPLQAYASRPRAKGGFALEGHTCNAIVSAKVIRQHGLRFDTRFNETGGEDTAFFMAISSLGFTILYADRAIIHEWVPQSRMKTAWLLRRWYRTANATARIEGSSASARARCLVLGAARMAAGSMKIAYAVFIGRWQSPFAVTQSFYTFCRGAGFLAGALGLSYREYAR
jgi:glycosyltransferase involved in cell wall biosynthesis